MSNEQIPSMAMQSGLGWPQQADGPVAPQAGAPASSWSNAPAAPQAPAPAQFAPPVGAPVNVAPAAQQAATPQYGVNQQAAYASQPAQPAQDQLLQLAFSRLKSSATVFFVMSFVWFFTTPVILLLANAVRAQCLCTHAREIDAPSDVTRKVNIACGIAFGMLLLQVSLIILLIVSENMR